MIDISVIIKHQYDFREVLGCTKNPFVLKRFNHFSQFRSLLEKKENYLTNLIKESLFRFFFLFLGIN
jgi:hypothetical protein